MGLKISKSTLSYSEELGNVLLWDIAEDKIVHGCKRKSVKFWEKKCTYWMWWFVYSHQLHITQNWILKMQQGEILSSTYPVSHHFLGDCASGVGRCLLSPSPSCTLITMKPHGPSISQQAPLQHLPPFCPSAGNSSSIYLATTMALFQLCGLESKSSWTELWSSDVLPLAMGSLIAEYSSQL